MKIKELYQAIIDIGKAADPRGKKAVSDGLSRLKKEYSKLPKAKQALFDRERLTNPYADTRVLVGDDKLDVKSIMVGVDIAVGEVVLADRLREKGESIDLIISHHPSGKAMAGFYKVMYMQSDIFNKLGVPINIAEAILEERISEVERKVMPANYSRTVDAAKLLSIPFICAHTPADNCVTGYLQKLFDKKKPATVGEIIEILNEIPEYRDAIGDNSPPRQVVGKESGRTGKIFVDMTGGTEPPKEALGNLAKVGVGTIVGMHLSPDHIKEAKKQNLNVVIAGHIASDNVGLNLLLDRLLERGSFKIVPCSGFRRFSRG